MRFGSPKCVKCVCGRGSARTPLGELTAFPIFPRGLDALGSRVGKGRGEKGKDLEVTLEEGREGRGLTSAPKTDSW